MRRILGILLILGLLSPIQIQAKDLGVMGETYVIQEMDFMEYMKQRAEQMTKSGAWESAQKTLVSNAQSMRDRPRPVSGLAKTQTIKTWVFDPTITLENDVKNEKGDIIAQRGARVNPLAYTSLSKGLLFIDADDKSQLTWALKKNKILSDKTKIILVSGSLLESEKIFKKIVYFDQEGRLIKRFGIHHVPVMVVQEGKGLRITEDKP